MPTVEERQKVRRFFEFFLNREAIARGPSRPAVPVICGLFAAVVAAAATGGPRRSDDGRFAAALIAFVVMLLLGLLVDLALREAARANRQRWRDSEHKWYVHLAEVTRAVMGHDAIRAL